MAPLCPAEVSNQRREMMEKEPPFTPETLAERWGCTAKKIRDMCNAGELRHFRIGKKLIRIPFSAACEREPTLTATVAGEDSAGLSSYCDEPHVRSMPVPKVVGSRRIWDREALRAAFKALPDKASRNSWDESDTHPMHPDEAAALAALHGAGVRLAKRKRAK